MQRTAASTAVVSFLVACSLTAIDPPYIGQWKVNEEKSDFGSVFSFTRTDAGELRFIQGDLAYIVRFDGREYPHPLGGLVSWKQIDGRTWETILSKDGKVIGDYVYAVSEDGRTLTTAPQAGQQGSTSVYRRTPGEGTGLAGTWTLKTATLPLMQIAIADGYDLVIRSGPAVCKANFDDRDYPTLDENGEPTTWSTCRIARTGDRGFSFTVNVNGRPYAVDTHTVSEDGRTLTQVGGLVGRPPNVRIIYDRQ
jgi:hypothetical protein